MIKIKIKTKTKTETKTPNVDKKKKKNPIRFAFSSPHKMNINQQNLSTEFDKITIIIIDNIRMFAFSLILLTVEIYQYEKNIIVW